MSVIGEKRSASPEAALDLVARTKKTKFSIEALMGDDDPACSSADIGSKGE